MERMMGCFGCDSGRLRVTPLPSEERGLTPELCGSVCVWGGGLRSFGDDSDLILAFLLLLLLPLILLLLLLDGCQEGDPSSSCVHTYENRKC